MVLFKNAGLTCQRENQVPHFFIPCLQGRTKKVLFLADRQICLPSQYLCTLETDCVQLALLLFVIFAGTDIVNNPFSQFSETGLFFLHFRIMDHRTILLQLEPDGRNRYDMTWDQHGIKLCMISQMLGVVGLKSVDYWSFSTRVVRRKRT